MVSIIPRPVQIEQKDGEFTLTQKTLLCIDSKHQKIGNYCQELFNISVNLNLELRNTLGKENAINFIIDTDPSLYVKEGYRLEITSKTIEIKALGPEGLFYGIQSLRQLFPPEFESRCIKKEFWTLPCLEIVDYPRFQWRGYMLDCCRHFWPKNIIFQILDLMTLHKLNRFHWHLTEDQGWRIEIKKYPKLTEVGSKRRIETKFNEAGTYPDPTTYGGYYTQEEIKEIVQYAADRYIQVIPEIEMPGHSTAAIAAYPELSCTGGPFEVAHRWGVFRDVYCAGKEEVFKFNQDVLDEVLELFPSDIIHIGGDEVPKDRWKACPHCQAKMKAENIQSEEDLQTYFTNRIATYLHSKGRRLMGWNEILNKKLEPSAIGHFWMGKLDPIVSHLEQGRDFVVSRSTHIYLDHSYWHSSLRKVYGFDPIPTGLAPETAKHILGIEGPMWTEHVPTLQRIYWQTFPRLTAIAEIGWTPFECRDFASFYARLKSFNERLRCLGVSMASDKEAQPHPIDRFKSKMGK
jgi:hexosaminidase